MTRPMQPIIRDTDGVIRFQQNKIVCTLLDKGHLTLNDLAVMDFSDEDRMQFAQLIGYSTSAYGDLSYVSTQSRNKADRQADKIRRNA